MTARFAPEAAVTTWREDGWVLIPGLVGTDEIDAAIPDLREVFPTAEQYHADPEGEMERWLGRPPPNREKWVWPPDRPGFRPEQHTWLEPVPVPRLRRAEPAVRASRHRRLHGSARCRPTICGSIRRASTRSTPA